MLGLFALVAAYLLSVGPLRHCFRNSTSVAPRQIALFLVGAVAILLTLVSPLDEIDDHFLFSAHMTQHLWLTMVMPPLVLLGMPAWMLEPISSFICS